MLRRAPTNLPPLLTIQALKSGSSFDSNKRLCTSWVATRSDLLLEPTSVLDIRSPSPSSTLSSSFGGSCEGGLGSTTEKGSVAVSALLPKDGGELPNRTSLIEVGDGSVWKDSKKNGRAAVDQEHRITQTASQRSGDVEMGNLNSSWGGEIHSGAVTGLVGADSNDEESSSRMTFLITRNVVEAFCNNHSSTVDGRQEHADTISGVDRKGNSENFVEKIQSFAFHCNNCEGASLPTTVQNMNGPNGEGKLKDVKKESTPFRPEDANLEMQKIQVREGDMLSALQCDKVIAGDLSSAVGATQESMMIKRDQALPRCEEWLADLQTLPGNEFHVGDSEKVASIGMDDLESALLQPPSPTPDHSLMTWLLGESEDPEQQAKGTLGAMFQLKEGGANGHLQEELDQQFSAGMFCSSASETLPLVATLTDAFFPVVATASSISGFTSANLSPSSPTFPSIFPHIPSSLPVSTMMSPGFETSAPIHVNCLHSRRSLRSIDPSAAIIQSFGGLQPPIDPRLLGAESRPVSYQSSFLRNFSSGYPPLENKSFSLETKMPQSPMFASPGSLLSNNFNCLPTYSVAEEYAKFQKAMDDTFPVPRSPFQADPSLEQMNHILSSPSSPISCLQAEFTHRNRLHCPGDSELLQKPIQWLVKSEPGWQAMGKNSEDPFPHVNQEVLMRSQHGHDRLISRQRRHIQLPEPQMFPQCVQRGKVSAEEVQPTMVDQLLKAAEAVEHGNINVAQAILARLNQHLSPHGKPLQRAAFYFKEALAKQVVGSDSAFATPRNSSRDILHKISAIKSFCEFSPLPQFVHFTANQIILEEMQKEECIHLIDFELGIGGQWASFLQEISLWPRAPPKLRITTVASESFETQLTRDLLHEFARNLNISLDFQVISIQQFECLSSHMLKIGDGEAIAVNFSFGLNRLLAEFSSTDSLAAFLQRIKCLSPKVVTVIEMESYCEGSSSIQQFFNSLQYYAFLFDSLESTNMPVENILNIEKFIFAPRIATVVEGNRRNGNLLPDWRGVLQGAGFSPVPVSFMAEMQAEYLVQSLTTRGFNVVKNQGSLLLGWHGRPLASASAWSC